MNDETKYFLWKIWKDSYIFHLALVLILFIPLIVFWMMSFTYFLFSLLFFIWFDNVGFGLLINWKSNFSSVTYVIPYRMLQTSVQILLIVVGIILKQNVEVIAFVISWWFGVCDLGYYIVGKFDLDRFPNWLENWSVHWILKLITKQPTTHIRMVTVAIIGLLTSLSLLYVYYFVSF